MFWPLFRLLLTLVLAGAAGALFNLAHSPLPWMIGPMLVTAVGTMAGLPLRSSHRLRNLGQWLIGSALGLTFTPAVAEEVGRIAPWTLLGAGWALGMGYLFFRWLRLRQPQTDIHTAYFASVIGGASEMATFAEQHGARIDRVASAHSLRVMLVVLILPFGYQWAGLHGTDPLSGAGPSALHPTALIGVGLSTAAGALLLHRLRQPNPWVLGALGVAALLSATGTVEGTLPAGLTSAAQVLLGTALGTRFRPEFVRAAPQWLADVALGTLGMIAASAGLAMALAQFTGLRLATVLLGNAPGGMTEMCITAKVLHLGVPAVTAFHMVRYALVLVLTAPIHRRWTAPRRH